MNQKLEKELCTIIQKKKIGVIGMGREGLSTYKTIRALLPKHHIGIIDEQKFEEFTEDIKNSLGKDRNLSLYFGDESLKQLHQFQVVFRSPGVSPYRIEKYLQKWTEVTSQAKIFLKLFHRQTIGVTGTKGKSTTTSLIFEVLKREKYPVKVAGNLGIPLLDCLDERENIQFVVEFSSHQLIDVNHSPHQAVLMNFYPEHLDYYPTLTHYRNAKANLTKFQTSKDIVIFKNSDVGVRAMVAKSKAQKIPFDLEQKKDVVCFLKKGCLVYQDEKIIHEDQIPLIGQFNLVNIMPAVIIGKMEEIENEKIVESIKQFRSLPHRLENVGTFKGITFINDSLATIPEATVAAIEAIGPKLSTLIVGGYDRGVPQTLLSRAIAGSSLKTVLLLPETGSIIKHEVQKILSERDLENLQLIDVTSLREAVKIVYKQGDTGSFCLLSPAAASFNMFRDYRDRGEEFSRLAREFGRSPK